MTHSSMIVGKPPRILSAMLALVIVLIAIPVLSVPADAAYSGIQLNISESACTWNHSVGELPPAAGELWTGSGYYVNLSATTDFYLKTFKLYIRQPGSGTYALTDQYSAGGFYRWYNTRFVFANAGSYGIKVVIQTTAGDEYYCEFSVEVKGSGSGQTSSGWQMPVRNAYHTWGNGNSWGANCADYGRYNSGGRNYHVGIDLKSNTDSGVYAAASGTVKKTGYNSANGYYAIIQHTVSGKTVYSFYAHLNGSPVVWEGKTVSAGEQIGSLGKSGSSSGDFVHLHFAVVDTLWSGGYYGYATWFSGNKVTYGGVTYYNPAYIINNQRLP